MTINENTSDWVKAILLNFAQEICISLHSIYSIIKNNQINGETLSIIITIITKSKWLVINIIERLQHIRNLALEAVGAKKSLSPLNVET